MIALERNDRRVLRIIARVAELGLRITIPATALAQAMGSPARQARNSRLAHDVHTDIVALDAMDAAAVGKLLAWTQTFDIVDAHVIICAQRVKQPVVTSDPADLRRLAPGVPIITL